MSFAEMGLAIARDSALMGAINAAANWGCNRLFKWTPQNYLPTLLSGVIFKTVEFTSSMAQRKWIVYSRKDQVMNYITAEDTQRVRKVSAGLGAVAATLLIPAIAKLFKTTISYQAAFAFSLSSLAMSTARYYNTYHL
jgi:hypothetical protein